MLVPAENVSTKTMAFCQDKILLLGNGHTEYHTSNDDDTDCDRVNDFNHECIRFCQREFVSAITCSFVDGVLRTPDPTYEECCEECTQRQQQSVCQVFQEVAETGELDTISGDPNTFQRHVNLRQWVLKVSPL